MGILAIGTFSQSGAAEFAQTAIANCRGVGLYSARLMDGADTTVGAWFFRRASPLGRPEGTHDPRAEWPVRTERFRGKAEKAVTAFGSQ